MIRAAIRRRPVPTALFTAALLLTTSCTTASETEVRPLAEAQAYDILIDNGMIVDGSGSPPYVGDVAIRDDRIVAVALEITGKAGRVIDARGMAVAPGFINMLSWAPDALIADGAGESDIRQGVTLEVFGEGWSEAPLTDKMAEAQEREQGDIRYSISWRSLDQYFDFIEKRGIAPNVASFVGATTVRISELGQADIDPDPAQLDRMRTLVREAMDDGAMGVGSSLIYAPASYAETPELIALATESARCGGMYISHMRNESDHVLEAIDELIEISEKSGGPAEIYHLKQAGKDNWGKLDAVIAKIEAARAKGQRITANMYNYTAGSTGLDAAMPTWVQEGGYEQWKKRLQDPAIRKRVIAEMSGKPDGWENLYYHAGPDKVMLVGFKNDALKPLTGKTLAEVAAMRGTSPADTAIDLVIEDGSRVQVVYFLMDEENVARQTALPWMSFGSDAAALAPRGVFLKSSTHPRAYGNFARLLGKYVREEQRTSLADAVRRLTSMPAGHLGLTDRGSLAEGQYADVVIFDPATIADTATYEEPQQFAVGMYHVLINGEPVLMDGKMTGARPGRAVRGPGWNKCRPR
ncbi:MAG: D-aminoacylase [Sphingomonadales bacterium]|nr:D-aminoacylase [Sphingomonadales bacterium]NCO49515.1 D-aminoacylase [Sphingomonadales bacterium]NCP25504.1 D-aminoacylase [Sphingomonadales bacterium]NCP42798.1 D-aminoacylase [Sphingomonadales bacterium]NCP48142.1 D-aminoacylase [Sphingomonadales bacterium]